MSRFYLAALWSRREEMNTYAEALMRKGHEVTARWLWVTWEDQPARAAQMDLTDLDAATDLVFFSAGPRGTMFSGGGRCIEFGYFLPTGQPIHLIGPHESVFCYLPQVHYYPSWDTFYKELPDALPEDDR